MNIKDSIFKHVILLSILFCSFSAAWAQQPTFYYDSPASACDSFRWAHTGLYYHASGTYFDTLDESNQYGGDSIWVLHLSIFRSAVDTIDTVGCDTFYFGSKKYYADEFFRAYKGYTSRGCDSIVFFDMVIKHPDSTQWTTSICDRMYWGGRILTSDTSGALATFTNRFGCDSVVSLDLIVHYSKTTDTMADVCDSISWYGQTFYGGTPTHLFPNATQRGRCDSTIVLRINLLHGSHIDTFATECDSFSWRGMHFDSTAHVRTPYRQYLNTQGCDSAVHLYLTVYYSNTGDTLTRNCDSITWHGATYTSNDVTPTYAYLNRFGCDSVVSLHLFLRFSTESHDTAAACGSLIWRYKYLTETGTFFDTVYNRVGCDSVIHLHLTINPQGEGGLTGLFEIGDDRYVSFSQGNLQYMPSDSKWRFAEHQYDFIGQGNKYAAADYSDWLDLFGWGTSGYHNPTDLTNTVTQPYAINNELVDAEYNDKGYGPSVNMAGQDLAGQASNYDWGIRNAISNGGGAAGMWRTLTEDEWYHLLYFRPQAIYKRSLATVYGISGSEKAYGVVLLPESWYLPDNCTFTPGTEQGYATNVYSNVQWQTMQGAGAIFLPAAGNRFTNVPSGIDEFGYYWSSTHYDAEQAYLVVVTSSAMLVQPEPRHIGRSVRLVQDVDGIDLPCTTYGDTTAHVESSFLWYDDELTETGEYVYLSPEVNARGCDSIVVIHLTVGATEGIADIAGSEARCVTRDRSIFVYGAQDATVRVYDLQGRLVQESSPAGDQRRFEVPTTGIYMVKVGHAPARKVAVLR